MAANPAWTKGPWQVIAANMYWRIATEDYMNLARVYPLTSPPASTGRGEANARLIAAAPELYEALKDAVSSCGCSMSERDSGHRTECFAPAAQAALAKARGAK